MDWRLLSGSLSQGLTKRPGPWASLLTNASLLHMQDKEWHRQQRVCISSMKLFKDPDWKSNKTRDNEMCVSFLVFGGMFNDVFSV